MNEIKTNLGGFDNLSQGFVTTLEIPRSLTMESVDSNIESVEQNLILGFMPQMPDGDLTKKAWAFATYVKRFKSVMAPEVASRISFKSLQSTAAVLRSETEELLVVPVNFHNELNVSIENNLEELLLLEEITREASETFQNL